MLDIQSVHAAAGPRRHDRTPSGSNRYRAASVAWPWTSGQAIAVVVLAANIHDNPVGIVLLREAAVNASRHVKRAGRDGDCCSCFSSGTAMTSSTEAPPAPVSRASQQDDITH